MYDDETQKRINDLCGASAPMLEAQLREWFADLAQSNRVLLTRLRRAPI